jgi:acetyltransferase-like isoleucine patch superfamily enzyme
VSQAVLGAGSSVEKGGTVVGSVILERACVGNDASALDAVLGPEAMLEEGAVAADGTIIGASAVIAAGSRFSGARVPVQVPTTR